jgi:predicted nucleic acid-binding protein
MVKTRSKTKVICDAGPLIHLDELGSLQLMQDFSEVIIPERVKQEVLRYRSISFAETNIIWRIFPDVLSPGASLQTMCRAFSLDSGEMSALSILSHYPDAVFLTDDAAARLVATKSGYKVHGTVGILVRAIRRDMMTAEEVLEVLKNLKWKSSLYIGDAILDEVMVSIKNEYQI